MRNPEPKQELVVYFKRRVTAKEALTLIKSLGLTGRWCWNLRACVASVSKDHESSVIERLKEEVDFVLEIEPLKNFVHVSSQMPVCEVGDFDGLGRHAKILQNAGLSSAMLPAHLPNEALIESTMKRARESWFLLGLEINDVLEIEIIGRNGRYKARVVDFDGDNYESKPILQVIKGPPLHLLKSDEYNILKKQRRWIF